MADEVSGCRVASARFIDLAVKAGTKARESGKGKGANPYTHSEMNYWWACGWMWAAPPIPSDGFPLLAVVGTPGLENIPEQRSTT